MIIINYSADVRSRPTVGYLSDSLHGFLLMMHPCDGQTDGAGDVLQLPLYAASCSYAAIWAMVAFMYVSIYSVWINIEIAFRCKY